MQTRMLRKNDMIEKGIRYRSVRGCEKRNVHNLAADLRYRLNKYPFSLPHAEILLLERGYERVLQISQLGYHARTIERPTRQQAIASLITLLRRSRISLPTEGFALTRATGVQGTIWPLDQVGELRIDAHRRRDLHLTTTVHVDGKLRPETLATRLPERPDLLLWAVGRARVLAGRRDRCGIVVGGIWW